MGLNMHIRLKCEEQTFVILFRTYRMIDVYAGRSITNNTTSI